jgi:formate hydrogenlyase subunit 3/multisubunit Na+/H+ antiporter MnhD subunit
MLMWVAFFIMKLIDDYDGIMSWIGAPIVATFLLVISLPIVLILGLVRRNHAFASSWYSNTTIARTTLLFSLVILTFGHAAGIREAYTYTNSLGDIVNATRLHSFVSLPTFFVAAFSVIYWPNIKKGEQDPPSNGG